MGAYEKALLKKKYGWTGGKYEELMGKIIKENQTKIASQILDSDKRRYEKNIRALLPKSQEKKVILPDVGNIIRRSPTILKAADQGKLLMETVRERIRKDVKSAMLQHGVTTKAGEINKNMVRTLRKNLNETFDGYTKRDPTFKKPTNIEAIAVTETNSVANNVRHEYAKQATESAKDSGFEMAKRWKHNPSPKKMPRLGHRALDGEEIGMDDQFEIEGGDGKIYLAQRPYDSALPPGEVISCHCELIYFWRRKTEQEN